MPILLTFLGTRVGKYCLLAMIVLIAAGATVAHYHAKWKTEGEQKIIQQNLEAQAKELKADNEKTKEALAHAQEDVNTAVAQQKQAMDLAARSQVVLDGLNKTLSQLEAQRRADKNSVAAVPDSGLAADIQTKLHVRPAGDNTPGFSTAEMRVLDSIVTDYPNLLDENKNLSSQVAEIKNKLDALSSRITADEKEASALTIQRDTAVRQANTALDFYSKLYNAYPRNRSIFAKACHVVTLGLGCKPKKFSLPTPLEVSKTVGI
jgi:hypothetical protein